MPKFMIDNREFEFRDVIEDLSLVWKIVSGSCPKCHNKNDRDRLELIKKLLSKYFGDKDES